MANLKKLLLAVLNSETETVNGDIKVEDKHVKEISKNHFRVEVVRPATEENKKKHGPNIPDDLLISEYLLLTDEEAKNPPSGEPGDIIKGGLLTADANYKVYRIA